MYDITPIEATTVRDLQDDRVQAFVAHVRASKPRLSQETDLRILQSFQVVTQDGMLTLAGLLCFGRYPQERLPSLVVNVVRFPHREVGMTGPLGERMIDNVKTEGSITEMLRLAMEAITRNLGTRSVVQGLFRTDVPEYPVAALREALVNALGHRDYSPGARQSPVQVQIFPDRLDVISPGGLFGPVTVDQLGVAGVQAARNAYLMRLLEDLPDPSTRGFVSENRGTGVASMVASLRSAGMQPPQFADGRTSFRVQFSNESLLDPATVEWFERHPASRDLTANQRLAVAIALKSGRLTNEGYRRAVLCDSRDATADLTHLVELKLLRREGSGRGTRYLPGTQDSPRSRQVALTQTDGQRRKDRRDDVLGALAEGALSRRDVADTLGISHPTASYWLKALLKEGRIQRTTEHSNAPTARYVLTPPPEDGPDS